MLHRVVLVSLAMTACAILIPTKANAFSLTFTPIGTVEKKPGDSITFKVSFNLIGTAMDTITFKSLSYEWDGDELAFDTESVKENITINNTTTIANITFKVLSNVKQDDTSDFFNVTALFDTTFFKGESIGSNEGVDVVMEPERVPEPLTIFGSATALGCGVFLKRKSSKKKKANYYIE